MIATTENHIGEKGYGPITDWAIQVMTTGFWVQGRDRDLEYIYDRGPYENYDEAWDHYEEMKEKHPVRKCASAPIRARSRSGLSRPPRN